MNSPAQSRQLILDRIRAATAVPTADPKQQAQPTYIRHGSLEPRTAHWENDRTPARIRC